MDLLKNIFPLSFRLADTVANLIIGILIYIVVSVVVGAVIGVLAWIPLIGWLLSLVGSLVGLYCLAGIVIEVLLFAKVLK